MAKINGTSLLVYANGVLIAAQKSCTVSWEQDLPGATTKDSAGWEEHINGTRRATCDFDGLYSTTGLTADGLISYILSRSNIVLLIDGGGFPIIGEATPKGVSIAAVKEEAATISGSFKFHGPAWMLTGTYVNLITDIDGRANTYDAWTSTGISVTNAQSTTTRYNYSNDFAITSGATYKMITFFAGTGEKPTVNLIPFDQSAISNVATLVAGVNVITLVATDNTAAGNLAIKNTTTAAWSMTNVYLFKV